MFTAEQRTSLRSELLEYASHDGHISGGAITGSAAAGREDQWSDVDLAFGVREQQELMGVLTDWTAYMYDRHGALHHVDVRSGVWIYRVFLLSSTLQVDLAFVNAAEFRALAPTFRLVFGEAKEPQHAQPPSPADMIGLAWLYALHARSSIARSKVWQAEYMISGIRDQALALACVRHGLPPAHGRGIDLLPREAVVPFLDSLVRHLDKAELARAFSAVMWGLLAEIRAVDSQLACRLQSALLELTASTA